MGFPSSFLSALVTSVGIAWLFTPSAQADLIRVAIAGNADSVIINGVVHTDASYVFSFTADSDEPAVQPGRFQPTLPFSLDFPTIQNMGTSVSAEIIDIVQSTGGLWNLDISLEGFLTLGDFGGFSDINQLLAFSLTPPLSATVSQIILPAEIHFEFGTTEQFRDAPGGALTIAFVPEPSTFGLVLSGLLYLVMFRAGSRSNAAPSWGRC